MNWRRDISLNVPKEPLSIKSWVYLLCAVVGYRRDFHERKIDVREIDALVDAQNGRITPSIYTDPDIYELELERVFSSR